MSQQSPEEEEIVSPEGWAIVGAFVGVFFGYIGGAGFGLSESILIIVGSGMLGAFLANELEYQALVKTSYRGVSRGTSERSSSDEPESTGTAVDRHSGGRNMDTLDRLFERELENIYGAEIKLYDVLDDLANQTEHDEIKQAFRSHREETNDHIDRLEQVFHSIDKSPAEGEYEGLKGLIKEQEEFANADPDQEVLDVFNAAIAMRIEHYENAVYLNLRQLAEELGYDEAFDLFNETLREERGAISSFAESQRNNYEEIFA